MSNNQITRLAVVGGHRGKSLTHSLSALSDKVILVAVCDLDEQVLKMWTDEFPTIQTYLRYEDLLDDANIDAVFLATPFPLHARQAIQALRAGKHVLSEVIAATTLEDCWELVEAVEQTGLTYMMAENYCFMRPNMLVANLVEQGLFGKLTHAEGAYLHDCRLITHYADGSLTWRGQLQRDYNAMVYPTHSLGPVAQWLGIGKEGGDKFEYMTTFTSATGSMQKYYQEFMSEDHVGTNPDYWKQGDSAVTLIRTKNGVVITLRLDWASSRPHNMTHYGLQGTSGAYMAGRHHGEDPLVWIEHHSPGRSEHRPGQPLASWEPLWNYTAQYEHPLWKTWLETAEHASHGGGDFFVLFEFVSAILEKRRPMIDVYDAVSWSSVMPLSAQSVAAQGKPVAFPAFKK